MSADPTPDSLAGQLSRLVDGLLGDQELAELEDTLRRSQTARRYYQDYLATHLDLEERLRDPDAVLPTATPAPPRRRSRTLLAIAATIPIAAGLTLWWAGSQARVTIPPAPPAAIADSPGPVLAVTARVHDAAWDLQRAPAAGLKLYGEPVRLESGNLMLDLVGGQTVTLEGPSEFELLSESEMFLRSGSASLHMSDPGTTYIIQTPKGAVVQLAAEFSVNVAPDGSADVHVFEGSANASVTGTGNRTREERLLEAGNSVRISDRLEDSPSHSVDFLRQLTRSAFYSSPAGENYEARVEESAPLAWWRFESVAPDGKVPDQSGQHPLALRDNPIITGIPGRRYLQTDTEAAAGFAVPDEGIAGLDTPDGITVECLIHPTSERYGTFLTMENPGLEAPRSGRLTHLHHAPQRLALERMERRGSKIGHIHPDFAIRAMMRSPAGYEGGTNTYSTESHLLHRWIHVVFTNDGNTLRLYVDGHLSDNAPVNAPFQDALLRPIIGRMQPMPRGEHRQWSGGIDEVSLYGRVLHAEEILAHYEALDQ